MGIYSPQGQSTIDQDLKDPNELLEMYIYDELSHLSDEDKQAFINSNEAQAMMEANLIKKSSLVRLTKNDDLSRRTTMAAMQLAKEADDPLWHQLAKNRIKERELLGKINHKYASKATRHAKLGQKAYLKTKMPLQLMRPTKM